MTYADTLRIEKIEDCEGDGRCSACGREGLRWVAHLSDSTAVGLECAKKVLGYRPNPVHYQWIKKYAPVAEYRDCGAVYVLWQHKTVEAASNITRDGFPIVYGFGTAQWDAWGWAR